MSFLTNIDENISVEIFHNSLAIHIEHDKHSETCSVEEPITQESFLKSARKNFIESRPNHSKKENEEKNYVSENAG